MSKKNPEKFQQKQITDKKLKRKKRNQKTGKTTYFISIMYYSDQVYLHYYVLTFGAQIFAKKFGVVKLFFEWTGWLMY